MSQVPKFVHQMSTSEFDRTFRWTSKAIGCFGVVTAILNVALVGMLFWLIYAAINYLQTH